MTLFFLGLATHFSPPFEKDRFASGDPLSTSPTPLLLITGRKVPDHTMSSISKVLFALGPPLHLTFFTGDQSTFPRPFSFSWGDESINSLYPQFTSSLCCTPPSLVPELATSRAVWPQRPWVASIVCQTVMRADAHHTCKSSTPAHIGLVWAFSPSSCCSRNNFLTASMAVCSLAYCRTRADLSSVHVRAGNLDTCPAAVSFYVETIAQLRDKPAIELFYFNAKQAIYKGQIECDSETVFELAAHVLQITYGNFTTADAARDDLKKLCVVPTRTLQEHPSLGYCEERVLFHYQKLEGSTRGLAIVNYMTICESLPTYGIHYYEVKDKKDIPWWLGISHKGIAVYDKTDKQTPRKIFHWKQLENLYYRDKKFSVEVHDPKRRNSLVSQVRVCVSLFPFFICFFLFCLFIPCSLFFFCFFLCLSFLVSTLVFSFFRSWFLLSRLFFCSFFSLVLVSVLRTSFLLFFVSVFFFFFFLPFILSFFLFMFFFFLSFSVSFLLCFCSWLQLTLSFFFHSCFFFFFFFFLSFMVSGLKCFLLFVLDCCSVFHAFLVSLFFLLILSFSSFFCSFLVSPLFFRSFLVSPLFFPSARSWFLLSFSPPPRSWFLLSFSPRSFLVSPLLGSPPPPLVLGFCSFFPPLRSFLVSALFFPSFLVSWFLLFFPLRSFFPPHSFLVSALFSPRSFLVSALFSPPPHRSWFLLSFFPSVLGFVLGFCLFSPPARSCSWFLLFFPHLLVLGFSSVSPALVLGFCSFLFFSPFSPHLVLGFCSLFPLRSFLFLGFCSLFPSFSFLVSALFSPHSFLVSALFFPSARSWFLLSFFPRLGFCSFSPPSFLVSALFPPRSFLVSVLGFPPSASFLVSALFPPARSWFLLSFLGFPSPRSWFLLSFFPTRSWFLLFPPLVLGFCSFPPVLGFCSWFLLFFPRSLVLGFLLSFPPPPPLVLGFCSLFPLRSFLVSALFFPSARSWFLLSFLPPLVLGFCSLFFFSFVHP
ncbi:FERM domain-containing protein 4A,FERM domain-containing protein 4B [Acanthosepion pharaonis]|uniref:FERM domain-containing protein 4A,FERM domain-containing protein 4B n=1 Tax=Acanthosepion pharaonis TaxID=158019 RepID=A0A812DEQ5_ACAPH|nr:FERM domain-containing protein 4A,FERM domain-containing protein 4B [Sepia pharaonis]